MEIVQSQPVCQRMALVCRIFWVWHRSIQNAHFVRIFWILTIMNQIITFNPFKCLVNLKQPPFFAFQNWHQSDKFFSQRLVISLLLFTNTTPLPSLQLHTPVTFLPFFAPYSKPIKSFTKNTTKSWRKLVFHFIIGYNLCYFWLI